jgi:hypothetical protein
MHGLSNVKFVNDLLGAVVHEKLTVAQPIKKSASYGARSFTVQLTNHWNSIRTLTLYSFKIHLNIIPPCTRRFPIVSSLLISCLKFHRHLLPSHMRATSPLYRMQFDVIAFPNNTANRDSSAGIVTRLHAWRFGVRFLAETKDFSVLQNVQTSSEAPGHLFNGYRGRFCWGVQRPVRGTDRFQMLS